jgi:ABC-type transporter Mla subunit MlaD
MVDSDTNASTPVRTIAPVSTPDSAPTAATAPKAAPAKPKKPRKPRNYSGVPFWAGLGLSALWVCGVAYVLAQAGATQNFIGLPLTNWAIGISAIVSPVAMIWMVTAYLQRAADVQSVTEPLRRQLSMILGESGVAEVRIRRFNQAIREQLELLRSAQTTNQTELMAILERVSRHKEDLDQFEQHSLYQVKEIQDVIRNSMGHIEQVMDDKFTLLRVLDGKLVQSGDSISRQTEYVREQVSGLLQEIEQNAQQVSASLEHAMSDSKKLSDTARAQETSLMSAAESASTTLQDLSGRLDLNIAHFLEHAGAAHREAEKLAGVLDAQTRSLDEFSNTLPSRVSEAEAVLHGVADRLYASEQLAREQALNLSEKLAFQIDNLEKTMDRFSTRFTDIDGTMQQRRTDLDGLVVRISGATNDLAQQMDAVVGNLDERVKATMTRFVTVNDEARRSTDTIIRQLAETAGRYEGATRQLNTVSETNAAQLHTTTAEIAAQLAQFEALHNAAERAAADVQTRASTALQNLQQVLERLLSARDATQNVGDALADKMRSAIDQNERAIARLNEATRMTVQAMGSATDTLTSHETEIGNRTNAAETTIKNAVAELQRQAVDAEKAMREQNAALTALLHETQGKLDAATSHIDAFAQQAPLPVQKALSQIELGTAQGRDMLDRYGEAMQSQVDRLQQINARVSSMGQEVGATAAQTLTSIDQLNGRFVTLKTAQDETVRRTVDAFTTLVDKVKQQTGTLDAESQKAVAALANAAAGVIQQAKEVERGAEDSGAKIATVTAGLQTEAAAMRAALDKQAEDLRADLTRAEHQFTDLGDTLKQKTDAAYALLTRVSAHADEIARTATDAFDAQANKLSLKANEAQGKVDGLNASMQRQIELIATSALQVEKHATALNDQSARTTQQLTSLNTGIVATSETALTAATKTIAKLDEAGALLAKQSDALNATTLTATDQVQKATTLFGEQASKLLDTNQLIDQSLRNLNAATSAFSDQSSQIRSAMEQHNQRLLTGLTESVATLGATESALQKTVASALQTADQTAARFSEISAAASAKMGAGNKDMLEAATKTEATLGALGASITQQVASLSLLGDQINEQQKALATAADTQRDQMLKLFDQLGTAHTEASAVAERTIKHLAGTLDQIQTQLGALGDHAQTAVGNVRDASTGFADQAGLLIQHAQQAEQQARAVLAVTSSLQDQAKQLQGALQAESDKTEAKLGSLMGKINAGSADMRSIGMAAEATIASLQNGMGAQATSLSDAMDKIADRQRNLTVTLESQREALNGLVTRLTTATEETAQTGERSAARLTESAATIAHAMGDMDQQAKAALDQLRAATGGFANEVAGLGQHTNEAEKLARLLQTNSAGLQDNAQQLCASLRLESDKATASLEGLIGKLNAGTSTLRDTGTTAETTLAGVNERVKEATDDLAAKMRTVSEQQNALSAALDAQRDTMGGLVVRLTAAQDETAAAAERSAMRLADSTQQHTRQIDAIDARTRTAVDQIQAATQDLVRETGTIVGETGKADDKLRAMLATTATMQDQAQQMRATLETEAARATAQVGGVVNQLETAVGTMDRTIKTFDQQAEATRTTLDRQAEKLSAVADQAEKRVNAASDKVNEHFKAVTQAADATEQNATRLAASAEKTTTQLVALCTTMAEGDKEARDLLASAGERLVETKTTLQRELQVVAELSLQAIEQVVEASKGLATESDALRANLASSESALASAATLVREETVQLPAILDRSTSQIETTGKTFKKEADAINAAMLGTTDRYITTSGAVRDTLMDEAKNLTKVVNQADQTLKAFNQAMLDQIASIQQGNAKLSSEQTALIDKAKDSLAQLASSGDRLAKMRAETLQTTEKLAHEFETIESKAGTSVARLGQAGETLGRQITQLGQNAERAEQQLSSANVAFRDQLDKARTSVQSQIDDINRGLMQITAQLERTGTTLRAATANTVADIEKVATRFDQTGKETATQVADRTVKMREATEEVAKLLGGYGDQIDVLLDRLSMAGDGLKRQEGDLTARLQQTFTQIGTIGERLEQSRALTNDVSNAAISKLSDVAKAVEKQIAGLSDGAKTVTEIVEDVTKTYGDQTQNLTRNVVDAQGQILSMNKAIEEMQQRTDRMRVTLKLQGDDLLGSLEQILHQLSATGDAMSDTVDQVLQQQAAQGLKHLG